jgi:3-dehydroquinate synthetase
MVIAVHLGVLSAKKFTDWASKTNLDVARYPVTSKVLQAMQNDKKNHDGLVVFVLPTDNFDVYEVGLTTEVVSKYVVY